MEIIDVIDTDDSTDEAESDNTDFTEQSTDIVFEESAADFVLEVFGWRFDSEGKIVDTEGNTVKSYNGNTVTSENLGGVVKDQDGNAVPILDDISAIEKYVQEEQTEEEEQKGKFEDIVGEVRNAGIEK